MSSGISLCVLLKQVPNIEKVKFNYQTGKLNRHSAEEIVNPLDLNALETAVQIREKMGGSIVSISMGPSSAIKALKESISRGADKGILLTDARFAGADTLATSYTLACATIMAGPFDLIICGEKTIDGDTAQVGPEVAEHLRIPHIASVDEVCQLERDKIIVKSRMDRCYLITELVLPGLISVTKDINMPRLPTLADKLRAKRENITVWTADDLLDRSRNRKFPAFGAKGSPTWVNKVYTPFLEKKKCKMLHGSAENIAKRLAAIIIEYAGIYPDNSEK